MLERAIGPFLLIEDGELDTVTMDPTLLAQVQDNQQLGDWFIPIISIARVIICVFESLITSYVTYCVSQYAFWGLFSVNLLAIV